MPRDMQAVTTNITEEVERLKQSAETYPGRKGVSGQPFDTSWAIRRLVTRGASLTLHSLSKVAEETLFYGGSHPDPAEIMPFVLAAGQWCVLSLQQRGYALLQYIRETEEALQETTPRAVP